MGLPTVPGFLTVNGVETILESGTGSSLVAAQLTVGASGSTLPGQVTVFGDITANTAHLLGSASDTTLSVAGSLVITPDLLTAPLSNSSGPYCACASCRAALAAAAPAASLKVGSAADAAPASVELWGNTVVAFPTGYTGGTGAAPLLSILGDAVFSGTITAAGGFTGGATGGGLVLSTLTVGSPTGPTGSSTLYGTTLLSAGTGGGQLQVLPTSANLSGPVVGVSGTSIAILQCAQPDGSDQNAVLAAPGGISIACNAPAANFSASAPSASIGTPLGESVLDLTTAGAQLLCPTGSVSISSNVVTINGTNTSGNGLVINAPFQKVNSENWAVSNATGDYYAQMLTGSQWKLQAGTPTFLQMQPSGCTWNSPGVNIDAASQLILNVPRTPPTGGFTGGYTSNQLYARNDTAGWNFQSRESFNVNIADNSNNSGLGVSAAGISLSAAATGSSANFSFGSNQARMRMDNGGNYLSHYNATGGNDTSLSMNSTGVFLQSYTPGSMIKLQTFAPNGATTGSLQMEAGGNLYLSGGAGGYMTMGLLGATNALSNYFKLVTNQPRAVAAEGLIQFGTDGNLWFFVNGYWNKVTATGGAGPP